jgi:hypothetical protein
MCFRKNEQHSFPTKKTTTLWLMANCSKYLTSRGEVVN